MKLLVAPPVGKTCFTKVYHVLYMATTINSSMLISDALYCVACILNTLAHNYNSNSVHVVIRITTIWHNSYKTAYSLHRSQNERYRQLHITVCDRLLHNNKDCEQWCELSVH